MEYMWGALAAAVVGAVIVAGGTVAMRVRRSRRVTPAQSAEAVPADALDAELAELTREQTGAYDTELARSPQTGKVTHRRKAARAGRVARPADRRKPTGSTGVFATDGRWTSRPLWGKLARDGQYAKLADEAAGQSAATAAGLWLAAACAAWRHGEQELAGEYASASLLAGAVDERVFDNARESMRATWTWEGTRLSVTVTEPAQVAELLAVYAPLADGEATGEKQEAGAGEGSAQVRAVRALQRLQSGQSVDVDAGERGGRMIAVLHALAARSALNSGQAHACREHALAGLDCDGLDDALIDELGACLALAEVEGGG